MTDYNAKDVVGRTNPLTGSDNAIQDIHQTDPARLKAEVKKDLLGLRPKKLKGKKK